MIIGVDIGGTKTYIASFAENGKLLKEVRFETNHDYSEFLKDLEHHARTLETGKAKIACVAVPGLISRSEGRVLSLGNLPWKDRYIKHDVSLALSLKNVYIENDSKLAGLAEARYILESYPRTFYLTISTGIGGALVVNGKLVSALKDMEIGKIPLDNNGAVRAWEDFASGRSFVEKYGKQAVDIEDDAIWKEYSQLICRGLGIICASFQVDAVIFGGGLGQHLSKFKKYLMPYLEKTFMQMFGVHSL